MLDKQVQNYYYSFQDNSSVCEKCFKEENTKQDFNKKKMYIKLSQAVYFALLYVISSNVKKIFSFSMEDKSQNEFCDFVNTLYNMQMI